MLACKTCAHGVNSHQFVCLLEFSHRHVFPAHLRKQEVILRDYDVHLWWRGILCINGIPQSQDLKQPLAILSAYF